jgi:hypothetical protein
LPVATSWPFAPTLSLGTGAQLSILVKFAQSSEPVHSREPAAIGWRAAHDERAAADVIVDAIGLRNTPETSHEIADSIDGSVSA